MEIVPLGSETLGVRSFSVYVETDDLKVVIDPGLSVVKLKKGYPPTPFEIRALKEIKKSIYKFCDKSDLIIITHYHFDHFFLDSEVYKNKLIYIKDPDLFISDSQKKRAKELIKIFDDKSIRYEIAKGEKIYNKTKIVFSPIFPHGIDEKMGGVVSVFIQSDKKFFYSSDVLGFCLDDVVNYLMNLDPDIIFFDGPIDEVLPLSIKNIEKLTNFFDRKIWLMDHHPFRNLDYRDIFRDLFYIFEKKGIELYNFAKWLNLKERLFEGEREIFYEEPQRIDRSLW